MFSRLYLVLSFLSLIRSALGATCQPRAISLPLQRYTLKTLAEARGISLQIGNPAQQTVLVPSAWFNATYLYGTADGFCPEDWSDEVCVTYRGGQYDSSASAGAVLGQSFRRTDDDTKANWTRDDVKLQNTTLGGIALSQFEFGVRTDSVNPFVHKGEIGLGKASTILKTLADGNWTSSNSWSLFWGTEVGKPPRNGSITFGGYDEALIGDSPNITVPFDRTDDRCKEGMIVEITGMSLGTSSSSRRDVMGGVGRQKVCIVPSVSNVLTVPSQIWDNMASVMGTELYPFRNGTAETYFYNTTIVTADSATYPGDLSITINDALNITIPNDQLIFNETYIAANIGLISTKDDIKTIPIVRRDDMMPRIGAMFFSAAYLMVNLDKDEFTISQAQPTPATQKLIAIDTANSCIAVANVVGANPTTPSALPPASQSSTAPSTGSSGLSTGAKIGIVVGVFSGLAMIAVLAFLLWRRRRRIAPLSDRGMLLGTHGPVEKYGQESSEMYSENVVAELAHGDDRQFAVELDSVDRPSEVPGYASLSPREGGSRRF